MPCDNEYWEQYTRNMESLAETHIGKDRLAYGRTIPDLFLKQQWFASRIYDLGVREGQIRVLMRRCKSTNSPLYKKHEGTTQELQHVRDHLTLELLSYTTPTQGAAK